MTETIAIALITLAAGLFGASVGAFATCHVAKLSSQTELKKLLHMERIQMYAEFMDSYAAFAEHINTLNCNPSASLDVPEFPDEVERTLYVQMQIAYSKATLIASDPALIALRNLFLAMNKYGATRIMPDDINDLFTAVITEMRKDIQLSERA